MSKWYEIKALAADGSAAGDAPPARASISIFDEIGGWGVTAKAFIEEFNALPAGIPIELSIHSPGGNAFEALAMYHVLATARDRLTARVVGIAASAATLPLMAAGKRIAPANAYIMVHNPIMFSYGDAQEMREVAALLDQMAGSLANIYASNTGTDQADIVAMMNAETWLDGAAAANAGFIHEVSDALPVAASLSAASAARFARVPQALLAPQAATPTAPADHFVDASKMVQAEPQASTDHLPDATKMVAAMPADAVASACLEAGEPALAPLLIRARMDADSVTRRLSEAHDIRLIAAAAGRADAAQDLILAGASVAHARTQLLAARAAEVPLIRNQSRSDPQGADDAQTALAKRLNVSNIYSRRKPNASAQSPGAPAQHTPR